MADNDSRSGLAEGEGEFTIRGSNLSSNKGVSWGAVAAAEFDIFDEESVRPTLTIENGVRVTNDDNSVPPASKPPEGSPPQEPGVGM